MKNKVLLGIMIFLGPAISAQVSNPGFENGKLIPSGIHYTMDGWFFGFNPNGGEATPTLDSSIKNSGERSFKAHITKLGSPANPWNIRLDMPDDALHSFNKDEYVEFSFYARANAGGKEIAVKFRDADNGNWVQEIKTLTTSFEKYSISQKIEVTRDDYKLTFFLASDTGTFWIDDVSVKVQLGSVDLIPSVYHLSPDGDDENPGTQSAPFKTLGKASGVINGSDTLYLHDGNYGGVLNLDFKKGDKAHPIVVKAWPGDRAVIDGTVGISDGWRDEGGGIFSRIMEHDIWGVYYKDSMMMAARWPNASIYDFNFFNQKETYRDMSPQSSLGVVFDSRPFNNEVSEYYEIPRDGSFGYIRPGFNEQNLSETGVSMEGAVVVMNAGSWLTWATTITGHLAGSNSFEYDTMFSSSGSVQNQALTWTRPKIEQQSPDVTREVDHLADRISRYHCHYYIEGLPCLDAPGEWWYDPQSKTLWFYPPGGKNPNGSSVRVKIRDYSVSAKNADYLQIRDLDFYASTFSFESCRAVTVENCDFLFPGHSRRVLGDHDQVKISSFNNKHDDQASHHRLINCSFRYFDGNGIEFMGGGYNLIENVLLHDYNFSCIGEGKGLITSAYDTIRRVTIYDEGGSEGIDVKDGAVGEYNHLHHFGSLQHDGAGFQTFFKEAPVTYRYNWSHTTLKGGLRFDDGGGLPQPPSYSGQMSHNVSWTSGGFQVKGDSNLINNNLLFNTKDGLEIMVSMRMNGINKRTLTVNNLSDWILNNGWERKEPPGYLGSNVVAETDSIKRWLRDPENWDFRPVFEDYVYEKGENVSWCPEGSNKAGFCFNYKRPIPKIDSFPDLGPYESGAESYWIPGYQYPHASTPIPKNRGISNAEYVDLMWLGGYLSESSEVYFGTSESEIASAGTGSPAYKGRQVSNIYYPGPLEAGQVYYWRIDAIKGSETVRGKVWSFTAGMASNPESHQVSYMLWGKRNQEIKPLQGVEISLGARSTISNPEGEAVLDRIKSGEYTSNFKHKAYLPKQGIVHIVSDTLIQDTLEFTTYSVDILVLDKDSGEPVGVCLLDLGGKTQYTGNDGKAGFFNVEYGFYQLSASAEDYHVFQSGEIEIFSDTILVLSLSRNYLKLSITIIDRVSENPLYRAQVSSNGLLELSNTSGVVTLDKLLEGYCTYSIEQEGYFTHLDSVWISRDTSTIIPMTPLLAHVQFEVSDSTGPLNGVQVRMGDKTVSTDRDGMALFLNTPARVEYIYRIEEDGYHFVYDSLWLEIDTLLKVRLESPLTSGIHGAASIKVYPNPASEWIFLDLPFKRAQLSLLSMEGKIIWNGEMHSSFYSLDLTHVPAGMYQVWIRTNERDFHQKIVVLEK